MSDCSTQSDAQPCIECHKYPSMDEETPRCRFCLSGNYDNETHKNGPRLNAIAHTITQGQLGLIMEELRKTGLDCIHGLDAANQLLALLCYCHGKIGITADSAMNILRAAIAVGIYNANMQYIVGAFVIDAWNINSRAKIMSFYNKEFRLSTPYSTAEKDAHLDPNRAPVRGPSPAVWNHLRSPPPPPSQTQQ